MKKYLAKYVEVKKQLRHRNQVNYNGNGIKPHDIKASNEVTGKRRLCAKKGATCSSRKVKSSKSAKSSTPKMAVTTVVAKSLRNKTIDLTNFDAPSPTIGLHQKVVDSYHTSCGATAFPV